MPDQHRATPEQWAFIRHRAKRESDLPSCLLELRARVKALEAAQLEQAESHRFCVDAIVRRVEALEATQQDKLDRLIALDAADPTPDPAMAELRAASAEARPGGLVERIEARAGGDGRAAIREAAAWLRTGRLLHAAELLEQEGDRG